MQKKTFNLGKKYLHIFYLLGISCAILPFYWLTFRIARSYVGPTKIDVDLYRNIYIFFNNRIYKFDAQGKEIFWVGRNGREKGLFKKYIDFAVDSKGRIYVADSELRKIYVYDKNGDTLFSFGKTGIWEGEFNSIIKVSIDEKGYIYVLDMFNRRVQAFNDEGKFLWVYQWHASLIPDEITIDSKGRICVVDSQTEQVFIISPSGDIIKTLYLSNMHFNGFGGIIKNCIGDNYLIADFSTPFIWKIDCRGKGEKYFYRSLLSQKIGISDFTVDRQGNIWIADEERFLIVKLEEGKIYFFNQNDIGRTLEKTEKGLTRIIGFRKVCLTLIFLLLISSLFLFLKRK